jgi:hypothetical protein
MWAKAQPKVPNDEDTMENILDTCFDDSLELGKYYIS